MTAPSEIKRPVDKFDRTTRARTGMEREVSRRWDDDMIGQFGVMALWEKSERCDCFLEGGQPDYTCQRCMGLGWAYSDARTVRMFVTSISITKALREFGEWEPGYATGTLSREHLVAPQDRFTVLQQKVATVDVLTRARAPDQMDLLRFPAFAVTNILVVKDKSGEYIQQGFEPAGQLADYEVQGNMIRWIPGRRAPAEAGKYSVRFLHHPVFVVIDPPQPRADGDENLPWRLTLRRLEYVMGAHGGLSGGSPGAVSVRG